MMKSAAAIALAVTLAACGGNAPINDTVAQPADASEQQPAADATQANDANDYPLAPSAVAKTPCADDGARMPLSGVCAGRAVAYMPTDSVEPEAPAGCEWNAKEVWFGGDVMLYRGLDCGEKKTELEYAGGAHAAELSYISSALHAEAVPDAADPMAHKPIVRVATIWEDSDEGRIKESIGSDTAIAACEIKPAGAGYPEAAKAITARQPGADCGLYAMSETSKSFWLVRGEWTYAFTLPAGARDIDPASFVVVTPQ